MENYYAGETQHNCGYSVHHSDARTRMKEGRGGGGGGGGGGEGEGGGGRGGRGGGGGVWWGGWWGCGGGWGVFDGCFLVEGVFFSRQPDGTTAIELAASERRSAVLDWMMRGQWHRGGEGPTAARTGDTHITTSCCRPKPGNGKAQKGHGVGSCKYLVKRSARWRLRARCRKSLGKRPMQGARPCPQRPSLLEAQQQTPGVRDTSIVKPAWRDRVWRLAATGNGGCKEESRTRESENPQRCEEGGIFYAHDG